MIGPAGEMIVALLSAAAMEMIAAVLDPKAGPVPAGDSIVLPAAPLVPAADFGVPRAVRAPGALSVRAAKTTAAVRAVKTAIAVRRAKSCRI
jgi:hypothetical protein